MKKTIYILLIVILVSFILGLIVAVANPFNLRTKFIGSIVNSYLEANLKDYSADSEINKDYDHPYLSDSQEESLQNLGVDVSQLPTTVTPTMQACLIQTIGQARGMEIVNGAIPSFTEVIKAKDCLSK